MLLLEVYFGVWQMSVFHFCEIHVFEHCVSLHNKL